MSKCNPDISIILLTYNGDKYLSEVLASIFSQTTRYSYEVVAIDSGSSDRTLEILKNFPLRIIEIPNQEFGHGRTRNFAVESTAGRYIVFLTQDATPANATWLDELVRPLAEDQRVAGSYSRQLPRPDCNPWESRDIAIGAGPLRIVKRVDFRDPLQADAYQRSMSRFISFSNVSSCIRRDSWNKLPFSEVIVMVEDQEWCKRAIEAGYWVVYEPGSAVHHSHNHFLKAIYKRHFDYGVSLQTFVPLKITLKDVLHYTLVEAVADSAFIFRRRNDGMARFKWAFKSPVVRFVMRYGLYRGWRQ
jgi:rhamnosyltransferase